MSLRNVILASHGALCKGMYDSVKMIAGENTVKNVQTYSLLPGESALGFVNQLKGEIEKNPEDEYVIISDVFGGSVHSALMQNLTLDNMILISGMNMALVLEVLMIQGAIGQEELERLCDSGRNGIRSFTKRSLNEAVEKEDF